MCIPYTRVKTPVDKMSIIMTKKKTSQPYDSEENMTARIALQVQPSRKEWWQAAAKEKGLDLSSWMRMVLDEAAKESSQPE